VLGGLMPLLSTGQATGQTTGQTNGHANGKTKASWWVTNPDKSALLQEQIPLLFEAAKAGQANEAAKAVQANIAVDSAQRFQTMDGFGFALTGGSAILIEGLQSKEKKALLQELFSTKGKGIGISYLRISIGASDLDPAVFSYDDMPKGQQDPELKNFSIQKDEQYLIPLLREILAINPQLHILGSPWSAPSWMKDNDTTAAGHLDPQWYKAYATYLAKYIKAMRAHGINVEAITPQNEPLNPKNNPSMVMEDTAQDVFIKTALGPIFRAKGLTTKIIVYDHNCDRPDYPMYILKDPKAAPYVTGSAFHLYLGKVEAMSGVHEAYPHKGLYFTEIYTAGRSAFAGDLEWHMANVIIGAPNNWAKNVLEWNLASDPDLNPHTPGGCNTCLGAVTISDSVSISRNVAYYIVAHASKFVPSGSVRIGSEAPKDLVNVAFRTPGGKFVLIVLNKADHTQTFGLGLKGGKAVTATLNAGAVGTFIW
jgi:glucosylceramidase